MEATLSDQNYQQQLDRELVQQLNDAKYASLTSRAVSDPARTLIDRLTSRFEWEEKEERRSRKNKRSEKARLGLRRAVEGFVGDLLCAYADEKSGGWVYHSLKPNSFSGGDVSYRNFVAILKTSDNLVETKGGYQEWSNGFDPGGPRLPIRTKATRFRASPDLIQLCEHHNIDLSQIAVLKVNWPLPDNLSDEDCSNYTDDPYGFGNTEDKNIDNLDFPTERERERERDYDDKNASVDDADWHERGHAPYAADAGGWPVETTRRDDGF